ncbi:hypothetical protein GLYMA_19G156601v4 [Glycine max]|nr:hypothetical protein GLYMA_19G156601v4 [Glycine max]KAH1078001.1 hypothetical protein GYH30_053180 [Glycine max]
MRGCLMVMLSLLLPLVLFPDTIFGCAGVSG